MPEVDDQLDNEPELSPDILEGSSVGGPEPPTNSSHIERFGSGEQENKSVPGEAGPQNFYEGFHNFEDQGKETIYLASDSRWEESLLGVFDELESMGYDTERLSRADISCMDADDFDGPVFLRSKRGFQKSSMKKKLRELESEGVDMYPTSFGADIANDKLKTKQWFELNGISTTETYRSEAEVRMAQRRGQDVVEKPRNASHGNGFGIINGTSFNQEEFRVEPGDDFRFDEDCIYERKIDHWNDPFKDERRALVYVGENEQRFIEAKTRETNSDREVAKNYNNGCFYEDIDFLTGEEITNALAAAESVGGGFIGVDYVVDKRTGQSEIIEPNSSVQTHGIRAASEIDIDRECAEAIHSDRSNSSLGFNRYGSGKRISDHLQEKLRLPYNQRQLLQQDPDQVGKYPT